ncbi:polysaccharide pyruvyl transferase family protein [Pseudomonas huanghezhanensis]|uniref:polysaccharide pyruvyl transferase family protein n=1 Tax=Pseudomonas huanghezhanensis TaxID=3002903 RepID=UPI002285B51D|nr:polysaccharide pyruvyl transferase family protein [Pseudomonas sp. BSw22131]
MNVLIFNDKYSTNVGDGLLSDCLEHELRKCLPDSRVSSIDIDGKSNFPIAESAGTAQLKGTLKKVLPDWLMSRIADIKNIKRTHRRLSAEISAAPPAKVTRFVVGGGQLVTATSSYFPARLYSIMRLAQDQNVQVSFYAVGVSSEKTWLAHSGRLLRKALTGQPQIRFVSVRDKLSADHWTSYVDAGVQPQICRDPGLLASAVYPERLALPLAERQLTGRVGVGVIDSKMVNAIIRAEDVAEDAMITFFCDLSSGLIAKGFTPVLFTNGDVEDEEVLAKVVARVPGCAIAPRPLNGGELYRVISSFDGLIAHRMHANITAYSLKIPHVGLGWDVKLKSFYKSVNRDEFFVETSRSSPDEVVETFIAAMARGIDADTHAQVLGEARAGVQLLAQALKAG